jgi:hypothetical protein
LQGRSVSKFNALKSGIYAQSQVIPGEDAAELEALAESYADEFRPKTGPERFLVDAMLRADWRMRRLQRIETELWEQGVREAGGVGRAYKQDAVPERLYRRMDAAERSFFRALKEMKGVIEKARKEEEEEARGRSGKLSTAEEAEPRPPELASEEKPAGEAPAATEAGRGGPAMAESGAESGSIAPSQVKLKEGVAEELGLIGQAVQEAAIDTVDREPTGLQAGAQPGS